MRFLKGLAGFFGAVAVAQFLASMIFFGTALQYAPIPGLVYVGICVPVACMIGLEETKGWATSHYTMIGGFYYAIFFIVAMIFTAPYALLAPANMTWWQFTIMLACALFTGTAGGAAYTAIAGPKS